MLRLLMAILKFAPMGGTGVQKRMPNLDSGPVFQRGKLKIAGMTQTTPVHG